MSTESEKVAGATLSTPPASSTSAPKAARKKKKGARRPKISRPLDEREIRAPDTQTLWMLGVLTATSLTLWVLAHAACNYHPPRETRRPRSVTTQELTRDPKDAAIELQHRLVTLDYKGALEIAAGPLTKEVEQEKAACEANATACAARREAAAKAITSAIVLERDPMSAKVRVTTHKLPGAEGHKSFLARAERDATGWKITARVPEAPGAVLPPPTLNAGARSFPTPLAMPPGHAPIATPPAGSKPPVTAAPKPGAPNGPAPKPAAPPAPKPATPPAPQP